MLILSEKKITKAARISTIVGKYFAMNVLAMEVPAESLMPIFVQEGIFIRNYNKGYPIRHFLRQLEKNNQLHMIPYAKVEGTGVHKKWTFRRNY